MNNTVQTEVEVKEIKTAYTKAEVNALLRGSVALVAELGEPDSHKGKAMLYNPGRVDRFLEDNWDRLPPPPAPKRGVSEAVSEGQQSRWQKVHADARVAAEAATIVVSKRMDTEKQRLLARDWETPYHIELRHLRNTYTDWSEVCARMGLFKKSRAARFVVMNRANQMLCSLIGVPFVPETDEISTKNPTLPLPIGYVSLLGFDDDGRSVFWYRNGRFGPYVSDVHTSATVPQDMGSPTIVDAIRLLQARRRKTGLFPPGPAKKVRATEATAAKPPKKVKAKKAKKT